MANIGRQLIITPLERGLVLTPETAEVKAGVETFVVAVDWSKNADKTSARVWTALTVKDFRDIGSGSLVTATPTPLRIPDGDTAAWHVSFPEPNISGKDKYYSYVIELEPYAKPADTWIIDPVIVIKPWY